MRLRRVRLTAEKGFSVAVWHDGRWVPLVPAARLLGLSDALGDAGRDIVAFLAGGPDLRRGIAPLLEVTIDPDEFSLEPTLPFPPVSLRTFPLWEAQVAAVGTALRRRFGSPAVQRAAGVVQRTGWDLPVSRPGPLWFSSPVFVRGNHLGVMGEDQVVPWPPLTQALDVELALGVVVGAPVEDITPEAGLEAIGGFVVAGSVVARDLQHAELAGSRYGPSKSQVGTVLASEVVTADEVLDRVAHLAGEVHVGGALVATGSTAGAQHPPGAVVARAAEGERLVPGELLLLAGVPGCSGLEADRWVSPGDVVELVLEGVGRLQCEIGDPRPYLRPGPLPRARWTVVERRGHGPDLPPLEPVAWDPPECPPLEGVWAPDTTLDDVEVWPTPGGAKPEDVCVDAEGRVYAGVEDGRIFRWPAGGGPAEVVADTHGRPLGLEPAPDGTVVVCDADRGLLRLDPAGRRLTPLVTSHAGLALKFCNNAAVASDGTIWFTDTSTRFGVHDHVRDLLEHGSTGRLFRLAPGASEPELVLSGLHFPNGVALTADESALLVVETSTYRILCHRFGGWGAGQTSVLLDNLPAFPDNLSTAPDGTFWVGLPELRVAALDRTLPHPGLRRAIDRLPESVQPRGERYGLVARLDREGTVLTTLHGPAGRFAMVTGAREHDGWLYLSSLVEPGIARVRLPD